MYEDMIQKAFLRIFPPDTIFASEVGICVRKSILMRRYHTRKPIDVIVMEEGIAIHETIQTYLQMNMKCQVEVQMETEIEGVKLSARADLICERDGETDLIELKSSGYQAWEVKRYHANQVALYYHILKEKGVKVDNVLIIYVNRKDYSVKEFVMAKPALEKAYQEAVEFIRIFAKNREAKDIRRLPLPEKFFCKSCDFYNFCYSGGNIIDLIGTSGTKA